MAGFLGRRLAYTSEMTERIANERLVKRTAEGPFPMMTTCTWEARREGQTRMTLRDLGEPSGFSRLVAPVMTVAMRRANTRDLVKRKALLERGGYG